MNLRIENYTAQKREWPNFGRHIMAQYDEESIIVYQAYRPAIGNFAAQHQYFGGEFKLSRMSWIKPNFLWLMYRCGWATKEGQEVVLAIRMQRLAFDYILSQAVYSSYQPQLYLDHDDWKNQLAQSEVRLQWDPDHNPKGKKEERRAIQLGMSGDTLKKYSREWLLDIQDITPFVQQQHEHAQAGYELLQTPAERPYVPAEQAVRSHLQLEGCQVHEAKC